MERKDVATDEYDDKLSLDFCKRRNKQPAQDRLKRLQNNLKTQIKNQNKDTATKPKHNLSLTSRIASSDTPTKPKNNLSLASRLASSATTQLKGVLQQCKQYFHVDNKFTNSTSQNHTSPLAATSKRNDDEIVGGTAIKLQKPTTNNWQKPKALIDSTLSPKTPKSSVNERLAKIRASCSNTSSSSNEVDSEQSPIQMLPQTETLTLSQFETSAFKPEPKLEINSGNDKMLLSLRQMQRLKEVQRQQNRRQQRRLVGRNAIRTNCLKDTPKRAVCQPTDEEVEPMDCDDMEEEKDIALLRSDYTDLPPRCQDRLYFVLDTNTLIGDLAFVKDLTKVKLNGTEGSMLYLPYIVIKELDRLKSRKINGKDSLRLCAIRAIQFLNSKFDDSLDIQAQSAQEESRYLIEVDNADDSIVNCCLQLKEEVDHMMLLTNDANLQLKAKASDIQVSCPSKLQSDYSEIFDAAEHF